ncbi:MAG: protein kinase family protein [Leptolyngbyaceae cyanobacterium MO_188.B28]|nr:protein kinase family protein [Leptolyngbyaceae cyanobacterium MO_188.B28]
MNKLLGGRYQPIRVIGSSQLGKTYLMADAHYPDFPKCIVKHLELPGKNPTTLKFISKFLKRKVGILEKLGEHDQIPEILAFFEEGRNFYIIQEYIPGHSLATELIPGKPWPEVDVIELLKELLEILIFAQAYGVIHCRIKPSNIIRRQTDGKLVLTDFGIAKEVNSQIMKAGGQLETADLTDTSVYLPPEQLNGQSHFSNDFYALGILAIQALTGLAPADLPTARQISQSKTKPLAWQGKAQVNSELAIVINKAISPDPSRRYQRASDLLADLQGIVMSCPTSAFSAVPVEDKKPDPKSGFRPFKSHSSVALASVVGVSVLAALIGIHRFQLPQKLRAYYLVNQANTQKQDRNEALAIANYNRAIQINPNYGEAYAGRGDLHSKQGNLEQALSDLTAAINLKSENSSHYYQRANIRFDLGDLQGAIEDYTQSIKLEPTLAKAYVNRGSARAEWGDDQGAVEDYTKAIELSPEQPELAAAYLNRCLSYSNLDDNSAAIKDCTQAINLRPSHSLAYQNRGLVRRRVGDPQGAIQDFNIAINIDPNSPDPYYSRGLARHELGDFEGAIEDYDRALQLNSEHPFFYHDRGIAYAELGQQQAAIHDLEQAAKHCLNLGRVRCYEDAQYELGRLTQSLLEE